jgi:hypothetical protein
MNDSNQASGLSGIIAFYMRQFKSLFWMLLSIAVGLALRESWPGLKEGIDLATMALLSGIAGIIGPNLPQFARAGGVITKRDNSLTNTLIGAGITLLFLLLVSSLFANI